MDAKEIIQYIADSKKQTPVKVYVKGNLKGLETRNYKIEAFLEQNTGIVFGNWKEVKRWLEDNQDHISLYNIESDRCLSGIPLLDYTKQKARIEPGAFIREKVEIGEGAVIMMGATVNIGAVIGERTMVDMNAVIGGRGLIGKDCHIGAGAVIAGVIEPPSAKPVTIGDGVVVGANAVILEGVTVGKGSVIAAGAIVTKDVPENSVAVGMPAKVIKTIDEQTKSKTEIVADLRRMEEE